MLDILLHAVFHETHYSGGRSFMGLDRLGPAADCSTAVAPAKQGLF